MVKVSIITPVYNAERYLRRALESLLQQSFGDFEAICVNDGSTDMSLEILREYEEKDARIKIFSQDNAGGSAARNAGLAQAKGEYVMFLDADDEYSHTIIEHAYSRAVEANVDIVLYNFARFVGKPSKLAVVSKIAPHASTDIFTKDTYGERIFNDFATITWNKLIKRSVLTESGVEFDETLSHNHDVDFSIRLMLAAKTYAWLDEVGYFYRSNDAGLTATRRDDPTNVLRILMNLRKIATKYDARVLQSFDRYVIDMISGTLAKYSRSKQKQEQVFLYAYNTVIPAIKPDTFKDASLGDKELLCIAAGEYGEYRARTHTLGRRVRLILRRLYDVIQKVYSAFVV